ncbi:2,3-bisphosphoglycerate-independent phosphoglycerate mutase [Natranaeroarchaeum aerophilus]|uniref:2,3-bisphosphoglycerate-independent phosphoglycerate mutase n=1 Tax=Natranaeroarchaeum aerophilus TaxID=2917711 RepID=A0AAE3FN98_9EURY|nr:2,3-bisphosphoglycerate-independent phosphoglycerate mutase [Natranaeroarchaeum aerophilus]MCL9812692.1 2,3-bisphosphoglycerate-independent phosphoglycerate mutase [Natranaeroarchaeum aerophilus]
MDAALIILDGWGIGEHDRRDAVKAANTPNFDRLADTGAYGTLTVAGRRVGLPDGQMGNSEVGHLNIGAGRVVYQEYTRINDAIEDGSFQTNDAIQTAFDHAEEHDGRVHFMGLVSDGGVHSSQEHLHALIEMAAEHGVEATTHAFMDGRDTAPHGGEGYLEDLEATIDEHGTGQVATVTGRYYAMDRDQNWERTRRAYDAIVNRDGDHTATSAVEAVTESYERDTTDEFVEPTIIDDGAALEDGDSVVFFNFRSDRARQLTRMLADIRPEWAFETSPPDVTVTTMTQYDKTFDVPVAFPPTQPADVLGEVLADSGRTQLRLAESEKYAHVTYFLNGGREVEFDGEIREIVESPDVPTYDLQPEMSAPEVTQTAIDVLDSDDPDAMVLNYANPDMVGHTGDYEAAIEAVEAVDEQLGRLADALEEDGAEVLITADHGNADDMGTEDDPHTAHTYNLVPFIYVGSEGDDAGKSVREDGSLCDLAPTMLDLMDIDQPGAMTGENLLE